MSYDDASIAFSDLSRDDDEGGVPPLVLPEAATQLWAEQKGAILAKSASGWRKLARLEPLQAERTADLGNRLHVSIRADRRDSLDVRKQSREGVVIATKTFGREIVEVNAGAGESGAMLHMEDGELVLVSLPQGGSAGEGNRRPS